MIKKIKVNLIFVLFIFMTGCGNDNVADLKNDTTNYSFTLYIKGTIPHQAGLPVIMYNINKERVPPYYFVYQFQTGKKLYLAVNNIDEYLYNRLKKLYPEEKNNIVYKDKSAKEILDDYCDHVGMNWEQQGREIIFTKK